MREIEEYLVSDPEFGQELIGLLIGNLIEFRDSLSMTVKEGKSIFFFKAHHKLRTTLDLIGNKKLELQADQIHATFKDEGISAVDKRTQNAFCRLCKSSIETLESKLKNYQTAL